MQLAGRVAVITGGTRGIGLAIARAYLDEGARVVINGRDEARGKEAVEELAADDRVLFVPGDVTRREDVDQLVDTAVNHFGRLDIMVNNVGTSAEIAPIVEMSDAGWQGTMDAVLSSAFWGTRRAFKYMIPQRSGRIINMSSIEGKRGFPTASPYVAAKHGLLGLTKSGALEVGELGITVNAIAPGLVATDMVEKGGRQAAQEQGITFEEFVHHYTKDTAVKRLLQASEVAAVAVLLASDAGSGITGACLGVDGGGSWF
jgi:NAD(P)-dependent dehydrogenase (short-subunit alcohol dehydrogenase family)